MPGEPTEPDPSPPPNPTLDYARPVVVHCEPGVHPPLILCLLALAALAGIWSIIIGVSCLGDAWVFGVLLIGAGICQCWATIGKLSAGNLRPNAAIALLIPAIILNATTSVLAHQIYIQKRDSFARQLPLNQSAFRQLPTDAERQVFTYGLFRDGAIASASLAGICTLYAFRLKSRPSTRD